MTVPMADLDPHELLKVAYGMALKSPDPSTQNGAVVLDVFGRQIGTGCNTFSLGVNHSPDLFERPKKYAFIEHAERTALFRAARFRETQPHTLVCAWAACADCARAIVGMGVQVLIRHVRTDDEGRWNESIAWGDEIMEAAGLKIIDVAGELGCDPVLFNGKLMNP